MRTRAQLVEYMAAGGVVDFLFFWGHTPKAADTVDASCLSQWFPRSFRVNDVSYPTAEHFMMAEKARLFHDVAALARIVQAPSAAEAKAAGRSVRNYVDSAWEEARFDAVVRGNVAKFAAHADLRAFLLATGERVLVEASPRDTIWGIGMGAAH